MSEVNQVSFITAVSPNRVTFPAENKTTLKRKEPSEGAFKNSPQSSGEIISGNNYTITSLNGEEIYGSSAIIDDIDGDGKKEIIVHTDTDYENQHIIYVIKEDGTIKPGWPQVVAKDWGYYFLTYPSSGDFVEASPGKEVVLPNWQSVYVFNNNGGRLIGGVKTGTRPPAIISNFMGNKSQLAFIADWHTPNTYIKDRNLATVSRHNFIIKAAADVNNDGETELIGYKPFIIGSSTVNNYTIIIKNKGTEYDLITYNIANTIINFRAKNIHSYNDFYNSLPESVKHFFQKGSDLEKGLLTAFEESKPIFLNISKANGQSLAGWPVNINTAGDYSDDPEYLDCDIITGDVNRDGNYEIFLTMNCNGYIRGFKQNGQTLAGWGEIDYSYLGIRKIFLSNVYNKNYLNLISYNGEIFDQAGNIKAKYYFYAPLFIDSNQDGKSEVIYSQGSEISSFDIITNRETKIFSASPQLGNGPSLEIFAIGDLDSNGFLEIVCGFNEYEGNKPIPKILIAKTGIRANPLPGLDWPMLHNNPGRTNSQPRLPVITAVRYWDKYE